MTRQTYRLTRRYRDWPAGHEVALTEAEAIRVNNEAPGALEGPIRPAAPPKPAPKVTADADV